MTLREQHRIPPSSSESLKVAGICDVCGQVYQGHPNRHAMCEGKPVASPRAEVPVCGSPDPHSPRRCSLPSGHDGCHDDSRYPVGHDWSTTHGLNRPLNPAPEVQPVPAPSATCKYCLWWQPSNNGKLCVKCGKVFGGNIGTQDEPAAAPEDATAEILKRLDAPPMAACSKCGRKTWSDEMTCGMPQPNGDTCDGVFVAAAPEGQQGEAKASECPGCVEHCEDDLCEGPHGPCVDDPPGVTSQDDSVCWCSPGCREAEKPLNPAPEGQPVPAGYRLGWNAAIKAALRYLSGFEDGDLTTAMDGILDLPIEPTAAPEGQQGERLFSQASDAALARDVAYEREANREPAWCATWDQGQQGETKASQASPETIAAVAEMTAKWPAAPAKASEPGKVPLSELARGIVGAEIRPWLVDGIVALEAELAEAKRERTDEQGGALRLRERFGAKLTETFPMFVERLAGERDAARADYQRERNNYDDALAKLEAARAEVEQLRGKLDAVKRLAAALDKGDREWLESEHSADAREAAMRSSAAQLQALCDAMAGFAHAWPAGLGSALATARAWLRDNPIERLPLSTGVAQQTPSELSPYDFVRGPERDAALRAEAQPDAPAAEKTARELIQDELWKGGLSCITPRGEVYYWKAVELAVQRAREAQPAAIKAAVTAACRRAADGWSRRWFGKEPEASMTRDDFEEWLRSGAPAPGAVPNGGG